MTAKWDFFQVDLRPQEWMRQAACKDHPDPDLWFPERGGSVLPALELCSACPVREKCADFGLMEVYGVWGAMTELQRRARRRFLRPPTAKTCKNGHPYTEENSLFDSQGRRLCRECRRQTTAAYNRRKAYQ